MNRYLSRLAPVALVILTALGSAACTAPTDASGSFDLTGAGAVHVLTNPDAVDAALLANEAENLDRISSELQSIVTQVNGTVSSLSSCQGQACTALQAAHRRYMDAATRQMHQLNEIRTAVGVQGHAYADADEEQRSALGGQMGFLSGGALQWSFGAIDGAASELQAATVRTAALLDEARASLTRLAPAWGGTGSAVYQRVQMTWNAGSDELTAGLRSVVMAVSAMRDAMQQTDGAAAGMFAG